MHLATASVLPLVLGAGASGSRTERSAAQAVGAYVRASYTATCADDAVGCGVRNATASELRALADVGASRSLAGDQVIAAILARPSTRSCLDDAEAGLT